MYIKTDISSEATVPSSPAPFVFSDDAQRASSPPSSPPGFPWEKHATHEQSSKHVTKPSPSMPIANKSAFSVLGKRKQLAEITVNGRPAKKTSNESNNASKPLTQLQINLGQQVQVKCKSCGMEYVSSSAEDRKLHAKFHDQNNEGYTLSKDFVRKTPQHQLLNDPIQRDTICAVDCRDNPHRIRHAQSALTIVERELGAAPLDVKAVWPRAATATSDLKPPYCAYMYIHDTKCVGYLLIQRIGKAFAVLEPPSPPASRQPANLIQHTSALAALKARRRQVVEDDNDQPLQISCTPSHARMGISRIWTAPAHRNQNIATRLLDAAFAHHCPSHQSALKEIAPRKSGRKESSIGKSCVPSSESKALVAFSQPTEAGKRLARRWFGKKYGWLIYVE